MRKKYRIFLWCCLSFAIVFTCWYTKYAVEKALPDEIRLLEQEEQNIDFNLPVQASISEEEMTETSFSGKSNIPSGAVSMDLKQPCTVKTGTTGSYVMNCKLFGLIHLKDVTLHVVKEQQVTPCGTPIGIYMETDGVLVIGSGKVIRRDGSETEPAHGIVRSGDYIVAVDGQTVANKKELQREVEAAATDEIILTVRRNGEKMDVRLSAVEDMTGERKLGVWVRDDIQGIGTLTYVDNDGKFGALGHGISDMDTGTLMELKNGSLYSTQIINVVKGKAGEPGELTGVIRYQDNLKRGQIQKNNDCGIYGTVNDALKRELPLETMSIGLKQDIKTGPAWIRCTIDGETKDYAVSIEKIEVGSHAINKGIVLRITDEELLEKTGGIVQGMSGSPIIQNGKLIGAVTHVFVQDSTKGYGIFIENMLAS